MTDNGSEVASPSEADRAEAEARHFLIPAGQTDPKRPADPNLFDGVFTMHVLVDLKICESCGSLWYRAAGGVQVYCDGCAVKLGEFPLPRRRPRPGGRRKAAATVALVSSSIGGGR